MSEVGKLRRRPVRVLVVSHSKVAWGAERVLLSLAPLLLERGFELVLASPGEGDFARLWSKAGGRHLDRPAPPYGGLRAAGSDKRPSPLALGKQGRLIVDGARQLVQLSRGFDLLHSNSLWSHFEVSLAGRLARTPTVLHVHDLVRPGLGRVVLGTAVSLARATAAISTAVGEGIPAFAARSVTVVPNGVDVDAFSPGSCDPAVRSELAVSPGPVVGILGRLDPEKGVDTVIAAVSILIRDTAGLIRDTAGRQVQLAIVGSPMADPAYLRLLESRAAELPEGTVRFVAQRPDVASVMRCLDVVVNASRAEPFGMTVLEAQSCGIPVVATRTGGLTDVVTDGVDGLLVPAGDPTALAGAVRRILGDAALKDSLARQGRRNAEERFSLAAAADRMAALYRSVLG